MAKTLFQIAASLSESVTASIKKRIFWSKKNFYFSYFLKKSFIFCAGSMTKVYAKLHQILKYLAKLISKSIMYFKLSQQFQSASVKNQRNTQYLRIKNYQQQINELALQILKRDVLFDVEYQLINIVEILVNRESLKIWRNKSIFSKVNFNFYELNWRKKIQWSTLMAAILLKLQMQKLTHNKIKEENIVYLLSELQILHTCKEVL